MATPTTMPPLQGAILISNPRTEMALSLQNPLRGNLNKLFRAGMSPSEAAKVLREVASLPKGAPRPAALRRKSKEEMRQLRDFVKSGQAKKSAPGRAKDKRRWISATLADLGGKYAARGVRSRIQASHASRFKDPKKKTTRTTKSGKTVTVVNVEAFDGRPGWQRAGFESAAAKRASKAAKKAERAAKRAAKAASGKSRKGRKSRKGKSKSRKGAQGAKRVATPAQLAALAKGRMKSGRMGKKDKFWAVQNPGSALLPVGDLAFTNPSASGVVSYLSGYALPVVVAGGVAGGVHAFAASSGLTEKLASGLEMIPVAGEFLSENALYTVQGVLAGSALAAAAPMVGGQAGKYLALLGGAAIVVGGGIDVFNYMSGGEEDDSGLDADLAAAESEISAEGVGDLAFTNGLGDLAFTNPSALGDGFAFETAPLAASEYGQSTLGDAGFCGADFSPREGQALLNGRGSFLSAFGMPSRREGQVSSQGPSHLAARPGHRWGWLIQLVGWRRAAAIAALPPKKRLAAIHQLRQAALAKFRDMRIQFQAEQKSSVPVSAPSAGSVPSAPEAPVGATNFLGEPALFLGA